MTTLLTSDFSVAPVPYEISPALQSMLRDFVKARRTQAGKSGGGKRRQSHPTHEGLLAKARSSQFVGDVNTNEPFQMPTRSEPVVYSVSLPRFFQEELNVARAAMAALSQKVSAIEAAYQKSLEFREWLGGLLATCSKMEPSDRIDFLFAYYTNKLREAGMIKDFGGFPVENSPAKLAAKRLVLVDVTHFAKEALKFKSADISTSDDHGGKPKKGSNRVKNHKPSRGKDRMVAVKEAIIALASGYGAD